MHDQEDQHHLEQIARRRRAPQGCAELALKKPPPSELSILIASCEATGPRAMVWRRLISVAVLTSRWFAPPATRGTPPRPANLYDEVVNIPLIWSFPSRIPPSITQVELVSAYDLLPTLCEFLLVPPVAGEFCGRSYLPLVTAKPFPKKQPWRTTVFAHYKNTEMARVDRYKVVVRDEGKGPGELYDLRLDRDETQNQYDNAQFLEVKNSLMGQLAGWRKFLV